MVALSFFLCLLGAIVVAPFVFISGGIHLNSLVFCIPLAVLIFFPTRLFWEGSQPSELIFLFEEDRYELRRGFRHISHITRGRFSQIDHLTIWSKQENSVDIFYTTSLTWNIKLRPMTLHTSYNDAQEAAVWADTVAQKLGVPLVNRIGQ